MIGATCLNCHYTEFGMPIRNSPSIQGMIPLNPVLQAEGFIYRDIVWSSFLGEKITHPISVHGDPLKLTSDTAICQVLPIADNVPHQPLAIIQPGLEGRGMAIGKSATAIGYVGMQDITLEQVRENLVSGNFKFNLHVSTGSVLEHFPYNATHREVPTPGGCFSASMKLPPGMSGSPVFDDEMVYVHGVVSRGWEDETGIAALGFGAMLGHSLTRPIPPAGHQSLIDLQNSGGFGIPKLQGPGM